MSINARTGQKSSGTERKWRWTDQSEQSSIIPESWAAKGDREDGEELYYAVEVRTGLLLEYDVDHTGSNVAGPHRERPGIQTLYVTADGGRAIVLETEGIKDDGIKPTDNYASVVARPAGHGDEVEPERRDAYRSLIRDLYGEIETPAMSEDSA
ncbi:hypothetical protein [Haloarcula amylovorans]|uniref:hypothetical protein n=1 Tax=Haloarcula amylovorans TaxID=2562280 RepID=UPI00107654C1|nr:hypothetical protein [Halomicroarcula amylolytica]